jgi:hypothetical protein
MSACQHDALDWFGAIGPTLATVAAVGATIWATRVARQVSRDGAALQQRMNAPRLFFLERARTVPNGLEWVVELKNDGQTAGSIQSFRVLVNGKPYSGRPFEDPTGYWSNVFQAMGLVLYGGQYANRIEPPLSIAPNAPVLIFHNVINDPLPQVQQCLRKLRLEIEYVSLWGERFETRQDLGAL